MIFQTKVQNFDFVLREVPGNGLQPQGSTTARRRNPSPRSWAGWMSRIFMFPFRRSAVVRSEKRSLGGGSQGTFSKLAGSTGFEPAASGVTGRRYRPA